MELFENNLIPERTLTDIFEDVGILGDVSNQSVGQTLVSPTIVGGTTEGGSYRSNTSGARLEIFPEWDPTIAQIVYNAAGTQVFRINIDGDNTGDVIMGDYANDKGAMWDNSASTFSIKGIITATSGAIGGWSISATALYYDGATDNVSAGMAPADYPFYAGKKYTDRATAPFRVTPAGVMYATGAIIDGTSTIGGTVVSTVLSDISGNSTSITTNATGISTNVTDISGNTTNITTNATGIATNVSDISGNTTNITTNATGISVNVSDISGNTSSITTNATNINLRVEKNDVINQINISTEGILIAGDNISLDGNTTVEGTFSVTTGGIAGFYVTATTLANHATANSASVFIDTSNSLMRLGPTSGSYLTLDGANQKIESSNYVSGAFGAGVHLSPDLLEVGNIACRGIIRTAVFQKDVISVVGGNIAVLDGDVLDADMDATDAETLTIEGNTTFAVNDILRIKDGTDDEWMVVTNVGSAPEYVVTRDAGTDYAANTNPTWKKGATVVNYGASGEGGVYMTASETNAPYLSIFTHAGSPWDTITTWARLGNLNGYLGYSSDLYGIAIGETNYYLKYDPTNHLRIKGSITITGGSGIASLTDAGDLVTVNEADVNALNLTNAPAAAGADVTGANTAADTTLVNGVAAATVEEGGSKAYGWRHATDVTKIDGGDIYTGSVTATQITVTNLAALNADLGTITAGNITIDSSGYIKGGQTAYNTGTGFFLGYDTDAYKLSLGAPTGDRLLWDGTNLEILGLITTSSGIYGDQLLQSADTYRGGAYDAYTKVKEIKVGTLGGTLRIKFDLRRTGGAATAYGRIYKNGVAIGTERSSTGDYETHSEDIAGWKIGDLIQIYIKGVSDPSTVAGIQNFRIYTQYKETPEVITD